MADGALGGSRHCHHRWTSFGRLDAIHNNAAISVPSKPLHETTETQWDRLFDINLKSIYYTTLHGIEALKAQPRLHPQHGQHGGRSGPGESRRLRGHEGRA